MTRSTFSREGVQLLGRTIEQVEQLGNEQPEGGATGQPTTDGGLKNWGANNLRVEKQIKKTSWAPGTAGGLSDQLGMRVVEA